MDSFLISPKLDKKSFIKTSLIQWELATLKNLKQVKRFLIVAIIILVIGFIIGIAGGIYAPLVIFIGILVLIVAASLILGRYQIKRRYKLKVKEEIEELERGGVNITYEFSDSSVKYHDKDKGLELKWSAFKGYSVYKNHIVLLLNDNSTSFYLFGKTDTKRDTIDTDYEKILEFAKSKLQYRKIK